jgi:1,4-alpha-glucan branching enzyme
MKGSLLNKMPGTTEQKFATLRALYGYMWAHPGKKLLFMGGELGQWREWTETESLDWHLLEQPLHRGVQNLIRDLNAIYDEENALWEVDSDAAGFEWIDVNNAAQNIVAFVRRSPSTRCELICVCNFSAVSRPGYQLAFAHEGEYEVVVNTDSADYAGSESFLINGNTLDLPPLSTVWLTPKRSVEKRKPAKSRRK